MQKNILRKRDLYLKQMICVPGYGNDQSYDRYPALRKIQL